MKKRGLVGLLIAAVCLGSVSVSAAEVTILYHGEKMLFSEELGEPYIVNNRVMIPLRAVSQEMQKLVCWDGTEQKITISDGQEEIILTVGDKRVMVQEEVVYTDVAPFIKEDRTYVPLRFINQCFGAKVEWDAKKSTVIITEDKQLTEHRLSIDGMGEMQYLLYTPQKADKALPLVIYLHGGSGKGEDLSLLLKAESLPQFLQEGELGDVNAYVVMPQLSASEKGWEKYDRALEALIQEMIEVYQIDPNRISLTGHSMGGTGTWELAAMHPDWFSCIAPLSGSIHADEETIQSMKDLPIRAFVGEEDTIVSPDTTMQFIKKLNRINPNSVAVTLPEATHFDVPTEVYLNEKFDLLAWMIGQER